MRSLGGAAAFAGGFSLGAVEPFVRPGKPHLKLTLAAYSFRDDKQRGKDAFDFF